jgi:hypothetical protein
MTSTVETLSLSPTGRLSAASSHATRDTSSKASDSMVLTFDNPHHAVQEALNVAQMIREHGRDETAKMLAKKWKEQSELELSQASGLQAQSGDASTDLQTPSRIQIPFDDVKSVMDTALGVESVLQQVAPLFASLLTASIIRESMNSNQDEERVSLVASEAAESASQSGVPEDASLAKAGDAKEGNNVDSNTHTSPTFEDLGVNKEGFLAQVSGEGGEGAQKGPASPNGASQIQGGQGSLREPEDYVGKESSALEDATDTGRQRPERRGWRSHGWW